MDDELIAAARAVVGLRQLSPTVEVGSVAAALRTGSGRVFTGVCMDAACGIGFCAEVGAVAAMVAAGENRIASIVAVHWQGAVVPPCGRCRELVVQVDPGNAETQVILPGGVRVMRDLLPDHWLLDR